MVDLIEKKKQGQVHSDEEIKFIINGYCQDRIPDYQMSAWMMAVCFNGLNQEETFYLTDAMLHSGQIMDLSGIEGIKVDKHSTGGVGDKTSLVLGPMIAACGVKVAKMSGRGLGHTGGTLDKLESIPGFQVEMDQEHFIRQVNDIGLAIIGQSDQLVLADKKMYALRDVSATVDSIPLIASSIMSKKLASGCDTIFLDVKYGDGAFMKTKEDARRLAKTMITIGKAFHKDTRASLSNMNQPLGCAIGNSLEVIEAIDTLQGKGPKDLMELCLISGSHMLVQAKVVSSLEEGRALLMEKVRCKEALSKLRAMVAYQHGDVHLIDHPDQWIKAPYCIDIYPQMTGWCQDMKTKDLGTLVMKLGGGRQTKQDIIDPNVGIIVHKKVGDQCTQEEALCTVYASSLLEESMIDNIRQAWIMSTLPVMPILSVEEVLQ